MKRATVIVLGLVALIVGGITAAILLVPLDAYRGPLERTASSALGREVKIAGPMRLAIYPEIGLSLSDVSIANMPGGRAPQMVTVGRVLVGARVMPLLSHKLEVTEVRLDRPAIHLEIGKNGNANWRFDKDASGKTARDGGGKAAAAGGLAAISVNRFLIEDGTLTYYSVDTGKEQAVRDISVTIEVPPVPANRRQPISIDGALTYNNEKLQIAGAIGDLASLMNARSTAMNFSIASNIINAEFNGTLMTDGLSGALKLGAHSVRSLAAWAGHPLPPGNGLGLLALEGQVAIANGDYSLSHTHLAFDAMNIEGDITVSTREPVLYVSGGVTVDRLDVRPYLAPGSGQEATMAAKKASGTEDAPFALGGLKAVNADLTLVVGGLVLPDFKLDHALLKTSLHDGVLKADMTHIAAYGGTGTSSLTVDGSGAVPNLHQTLDLSGLRVQPFLNDLIGVNRIQSTGAVHYEINSRGATTKAIARSLQGRGDIRFSNGTIRGTDLAAVSRVLQSVVTAQVFSGAVGDNAKTDFGQMGGTFTIKDGVLHTNDLKLDNAAFVMAGRGDVDFAAHTLEFHLDPRAKKGIPGIKLVDIGVPFFVKGPWDHPSYGPDAGALPKAILNKLEHEASSPLDALTGKSGVSLKSLFGGGAKQAK
jgi:AsmA protein